MNEGMLLLLVGSSGSGKNTIINNLTKINKDVEFLVSNTTREMRPNEKDGVTYNFVTVEDFQKSIENNEMLEYDITHKGYYGISKKTIENTLKPNKVVVKDITVNGLVKCREQLSETTKIKSIFLTESKKVLTKRLINRGEKNYKARLKIYNKEQSQMGLCDYIIKNTQLDSSLSLVQAIINSGLNNSPLLPYKNVKKINHKKINKLVDKLNKGKQLKAIKVALINNQIYVVCSREKYLASLVFGKSWPKRFTNKTLKLKNNGNNDVWLNYINQVTDNKFN